MKSGYDNIITRIFILYFIKIMEFLNYYYIKLIRGDDMKAIVLMLLRKFGTTLLIDIMEYILDLLKNKNDNTITEEIKEEVVAKVKSHNLEGREVDDR